MNDDYWQSEDYLIWKMLIQHPETKDLGFWKVIVDSAGLVHWIWVKD